MTELTSEHQELLAQRGEWAILSKEEQETMLAKLSETTFQEYNEKPNQPITVPIYTLILKRDGATVTIRPGFKAQVVLRTKDSYTFEPIKEYPFRVIQDSPSGFKFDHRMERVLDENSKPTAEEWLEEEGKEVLWKFSSFPMPDKQPSPTFRFNRTVYHNHWAYLTIPKHPNDIAQSQST